MNKTELVEYIAQGADISQISAELALNSFIERVTQTVTKGEVVQLIGFGSFKSTKRSARIGRNPATGAEIQIAESKTVKFTAGNGFKNAINQRK